MDYLHVKDYCVGAAAFGVNTAPPPPISCTSSSQISSAHSPDEENITVIDTQQRKDALSHILDEDQEHELVSLKLTDPPGPSQEIHHTPEISEDPVAFDGLKEGYESEEGECPYSVRNT